MGTVKNDENRKRLKQKESRLVIFLFCIYFLLQVFNNISDNYQKVICLFTWIKYKSITFYIKKTWGVDYIIASKGSLHFNYAPKE